MATAAYSGASARALESSTGRLKFTLHTETGFGSALWNPAGTQLLTTGWDGTGRRLSR